jgi:hypothetical protein
VRDLEIKTATLKGGADSSLFNIMQFLSNCAQNARCNLVLETRDDFNDTSDSAGLTRTKQTLGANSRLAIVINAADPADTTRDFWFRFKGGDVFGDVIDEVSMVAKSDYGHNMFRPDTEDRPLPGAMTEGEIYALC